MQDTPRESGSLDTRVKATAPAMTPDLEQVIQRVRELPPNVKWTQLSVKWPADDDGLWFFWIPDVPGEVQIESGSGSCPFLIGTDKHNNYLTANTPNDTANMIVQWLQLPGGHIESRWHAK